jgi:hypothetical protein
MLSQSNSTIEFVIALISTFAFPGPGQSSPFEKVVVGYHTLAILPETTTLSEPQNPKLL